MPAAACLALFALLAAPPLGEDAGVWVPTTGSVGESSVPALAAGPDGTLWAAGGGAVHRLSPGQPWTSVGRYAPVLEWDGENHVSVKGPVPPPMLRDVLDDLREAVEAAGGIDPEEGTIGGESVEDFLDAFVAEAEQSPTSPFRVNAAVAGPKMLWVGTGAGLFRATERGVHGPLPGVPAPVVGLARGDSGVYVATPQGLYRFDATGVARPLVRGDVKAVAVPGGDVVVYVAQDHLWQWTEAHGALPLPTPPAVPRLVAAAGGKVWMAGDEAVYRVAPDGSWTSCALLGDTPTALVAEEDGFAVVTEDALRIGEDDCRRFETVPAPWPGGMRLLDAARLAGSWFMSSSAGVFVLTPAVAEAQEALAMAGFKRALAAMPTFDEVLRAAFEYNGLDTRATASGARVGLSHLLPILRLELDYEARRTDQEPTLVPGGGRLTTIPPKPEFLILARWDIPLDSIARSIGTLFGDVGAASEAEVLADQTEAAAPPTDDTVTDTSAPVASQTDFGSDTADVVAATPATLDDDNTDPTDSKYQRPALAELRLRTQWKVTFQSHLQKLYRQRQGTLYRLWTAAPADARELALLILELQEIDAYLDAHTGGAFGRRLAQAGAPPL